MNRRRRKYLRDRSALEDILPFVAKEKTGPLDDFLDKEADEEGPLDGETLLALLDGAGERLLDTEERERVLELLRAYAERGTKLKLVSLIRDTLRINIARFNPYTDSSIGKSVARDMLP